MKHFIQSVICLLAVSSCQSPAGPELEKAVREMDRFLMDTAAKTEGLKNEAEKIYRNKNQSDLSIDKMDIAEGGKYKLFNGRQYYKPVNDGKCTILVSMSQKDYTAVKRKIRLLENLEPAMASLMDPYYTVNYLGNDFVTLFYPWWDAVSLIPPDMDYRSFHWFTIATPSENPDRKIQWTGEPFAQIVFGEWVKDCVAPVYDGDQFEGIVSLSVNLTKLGSAILEKSKYPMILMTGDLKVISANPEALNRLNLKVLKAVDFYEQMKTNAFINDSYKLSWKEYPEEIRRLGSQILQSDDFKTRIGTRQTRILTRKLTVQPDLQITLLKENFF